MTDTHDYILTVAEVADHYDLTERTIRDQLKSGALPGAKVRGLWRCRWEDVWSIERGPFPKGKRQALYQSPMLSKGCLAVRLKVGISTIDRYIDDGMPTRKVFGSVRIAPVDAEEWLRATYDFKVDLR